jgi:ubiquinone/menaquinone biosynthesis C-methylase UbiE
MGAAQPMKGRNERYHDRVAPIYDEVYGNSPFWRFQRELTWRAIKPHMPRKAGARIVDLGCGTGEWGLRCLDSGYEVTFVDLSNEMICRARERVEREHPGKAAVFLRADVCELGELASDRFALAIAQGDPLSFTKDPRRAMREIARVLEPGGVLVASVDNRCAAYDHYLERNNLEELLAFHATGKTEWLARDPKERFPTQTFSPTEIRKLVERAPLELLDISGKTALDLRRNPTLLEDPESYRKLLSIEWDCRKEPAFMGRASHLEITARKPK